MGGCDRSLKIWGGGVAGLNVKVKGKYALTRQSSGHSYKEVKVPSPWGDDQNSTEHHTDGVKKKKSLIGVTCLEVSKKNLKKKSFAGYQ